MLRQTLTTLRDQQQKGQTWQPIPDGPALKPGMRSPVVPQLRARLGLPPIEGTDATLFDESLSGALKAFQETHAIKDDGHLGKDSRAALNMPIEGRIAEVIAAMERWRWLPHDLTQRYVFDNVGGYWTRYVDGGKAQFQLPIIVGRQERETPLLISTIVDVVLNPSWTVPPTIIKKDVLPGLRKNPNYLETKHLKLYRRTDDGLEEVSAADYHGGSEYVLRQPPGEENPLGQYKLQFPNVYSIYMHDTDEKKKFDSALRNFSSGCIRVENVRQMVSILLAGQLTDQQIDEFVAKGDTKTIRLNNPLPVYITYLSVWSDLNRQTIWGPDQYGKDMDLAAKVDAL
jgi:murein L,D-transpeptidase YcbB/YkuD